MQDEIYSVYHLTIKPTDYDAFKALVEQIVEATAKEADTTTYEYVVNADRTAIYIIEKYRTKGLLPHVEQTFSPFDERFLELITIDNLYVYGETHRKSAPSSMGSERSI